MGSERFAIALAAVPMNQLDQIISDIATYHPAADVELVRRAYDFAAAAHAGQTRKSGEPYVTHPLSVAAIISELKLDTASVCAGLLHDCVEDTSATIDQLTALFGKEVAFLVDGVTKLGKLPYSTREEQQAENFRKMLLAMARDIRVILVKLCDRLDNMRSLHHLPPEKQERIAAETMQIYAPLANRLGIQWVKVELEDFAFKYLHPGEYEQLASEVAKTRKERLDYIHYVEKLILEEMAAGGVPCSVSGRAKHLWSIYQKMKRTGRPFEDIHDSIGFRVVTDNQMHCYQALGVAHQKWTPIPGRFKDYIALPKPNMYQSLHTAVIGPKGERIEIQIRTGEMHLIAEQGIAAHWKYKEGRPSVDCYPMADAWLVEQLPQFHDLLVAAKGGDPTKVIVATITGEPTPIKVEYDRAPGATVDHLALQPSCEGLEPTGAPFVAYPALRLDEFRGMFPGMSWSDSLCAPSAKSPRAATFASCTSSTRPGPRTG